MISHKLLTISSRDKIVGDSNSDFTVILNNSGIRNVVSIIVKHATFVNVFYNITDNNRIFTYKIAGVPTSVQISEGQYNIDTLIDALETAMSSIELSIVLNDLTSKLSFTTTTPVEFLSKDENPMADVLGILTGSGTDVSSFQAQGIVSLEGVRNVFVSSQALGGYNEVKSNSNQGGIISNTIAIIPINEAFGRIINYSTVHSEIDDKDNQQSYNLQRIDIKLFDEYGNHLDLKGHNFTMTLKVYYIS